MMIKIDHERMIEDGEPWTVMLSGSGLGDVGFIRAESLTLNDCIERAFVRLREQSSEWDWLESTT